MGEDLLLIITDNICNARQIIRLRVIIDLVCYVECDVIGKGSYAFFDPGGTHTSYEQGEMINRDS